MNSAPSAVSSRIARHVRAIRVISTASETTEPCVSEAQERAHYSSFLVSCHICCCCYCYYWERKTKQCPRRPPPPHQNLDSFLFSLPYILLCCCFSKCSVYSIPICLPTTSIPLQVKSLLKLCRFDFIWRVRVFFFKDLDYSCFPVESDVPWQRGEEFLRKYHFSL